MRVQGSYDGWILEDATLILRLGITEHEPEAYQRGLDGLIAAAEMIDTEAGSCLVNILETMRALRDDVLHEYCVRYRIRDTHLHGLLKEQLEFADVAIKAISEHMVAKEDGGSAVGVGRDE